MPEKSIGALTNLLEVRRSLRFIRINTTKNEKSIKPMLRYIKTCNINTISDKIRTKYCSDISDIAKRSINNIKLLLHIKISLETHLMEHNNLHKKLCLQNNNLLNENEEIKHLADNALTDVSTKFKSPINVMLDDLARRLKTKNKRIVSDGEDIWGILTLELKEKFFCVIFQREDVFLLKTYINEIPVDITDTNAVEFNSPSQAHNIALKIIQEDGL